MIAVNISDSGHAHPFCKAFRLSSRRRLIPKDTVCVPRPTPQSIFTINCAHTAFSREQNSSLGKSWDHLIDQNTFLLRFWDQTPGERNDRVEEHQNSSTQNKVLYKLKGAEGLYTASYAKLLVWPDSRDATTILRHNVPALDAHHQLPPPLVLLHLSSLPLYHRKYTIYHDNRADLLLEIPGSFSGISLLADNHRFCWLKRQLSWTPASALVQKYHHWLSFSNFQLTSLNLHFTATCMILWWKTEGKAFISKKIQHPNWLV